MAPMCMVNAQTEHTPNKQGIYDWAVRQRILMKLFSHWIHFYSLFIQLGETETLLLFTETSVPPKRSRAKAAPFRVAERTRAAIMM